MHFVLAYLDPGAGSMLVQAILAGVLGLGITIRTYGRRIVGFLRRGKTDENAAPEHPSQDGPR